MAIAGGLSSAVSQQVANGTIDTKKALVTAMFAAASEVAYQIYIGAFTPASEEAMSSSAFEFDEAAGNADKIINSVDDVNYSQSSLDKAFSKHATDFGVYPDGSKASITMFRGDIDTLLETGIQKSGFYRAKPGIHVYNPTTLQWAFFDSEMNFVTAFRLGLQQFDYLIGIGVVK